VLSEGKAEIDLDAVAGFFSESGSDPKLMLRANLASFEILEASEGRQLTEDEPEGLDEGQEEMIEIEEELARLAEAESDESDLIKEERRNDDAED
jgi:hypothetical protein